MLHFSVSALRLSLSLFLHPINERMTNSSLWTETLSDLFICLCLRVTIKLASSARATQGLINLTLTRLVNDA